MTGAGPRVAALVLAAGHSRRMPGANKLLLPVEGRLVVARVVDAALASRADPVLVVTGHDADAVRSALAGLAVRCVHNPDHVEGMGASLAAGARALGEDLDGALVCLGDMPWLRAEHLDALLAAFDAAGRRQIVVPVHRGRRGHPVLFPAARFADLRALRGDTGARRLFEARTSPPLEVPVDDDAVLRDVDTREAIDTAG